MLHTTAICRLALIVCGTTASVASSSADAKCDNRACGPSTAVPTSDTVQEAAASVVLEINQERVARQLPRLGGDVRLTLAAEQHARDMVQRGYFSHVTPEGRGMTARVRATGYLRDAAMWSLGETLAWGTGARSTPAVTVAAWMHSPSHRRVLLDRRYREIGVGLVLGIPFALRRDGGASYAAEMGFVAR